MKHWLTLSIAAIAITITIGINGGALAPSPMMVKDDGDRGVTPETTVSQNVERGQLSSEVVVASKLIVSHDLVEEPVHKRAPERALPLNVGDFIDPEDLPLSSGEGINVGQFIDPEAVPVMIGEAVNVGQFIDPEQIPDSRGESINVGVFKDPEAPSVSLTGPKNVGNYRSPPDP